MPSGVEAIEKLNSIDNSLKQLVQLFGAFVKQQQATQPPPMADDRDLDSQYGDETIRVNRPRDWTGPDFKGRRMSECPAAYLELVAQSYDYFAKKNEAAGATTDRGKPKHIYDQRSAMRARGWAARVRSGRVLPQAAVNGHEPAAGWATDAPADW